MSEINPKIDAYINKAKKWQTEIVELRRIALDCPLVEDLKWGHPCYTFRKANVILIHTFKEYCAVLFFKGALLKDPKGVLIQQTGNVQSARQIRFSNVQEILKQEKTLRAYIDEAIKIEKAGLKVELNKEVVLPEEFQRQLDSGPKLKKAFETLTPGRQRAYALYFSAAKQVKTREARVNKYIQHILAGKGLDDE